MTSEKLKCPGGGGGRCTSDVIPDSIDWCAKPYLAAELGSCRLLLFFEGICDFLSNRLWVLRLLHHISLGAQLIQQPVDRER